MTAEELVKIYIDYSQESSDAWPKTESFWAKPLGDDLFELHNVPFYAYDLHLYDVVRAAAPSPDQKPQIIEVVRRSGHRTVHVQIEEGTTNDDIAHIVKTLNDLDAYYEGAGRLLAFDVPPEADFQAVCHYLAEWEQQGLLQYDSGTTDDEGDDLAEYVDRQ